MATKKAASTKKASANKSAAAKTTVRTVRADGGLVKNKSLALPNNIVNIVFAELVGTFILTLVALLATDNTVPLYVGLTFALLVVAVGAVSGAHLNPAVTFGVWTMRKLKSVLLPFYVGAQFLGAMVAVIVTNWLTNGSIKLNFDHILSLDWSLFGVELVGAAVFMFGVAAVFNRREASVNGRALSLGLALTVGLLVSSTLLTQVKASFDTTKWTGVSDIQHAYRIKSATLNPAISLAATEATDSSFTGTRPTTAEKQFSRLTAEVVLGTLIGAAVGGNLYLLVAGARRND